MAERARQAELSGSGCAAHEHGLAVPDPLPRDEAQDEGAGARRAEATPYDGSRRAATRSGSHRATQRRNIRSLILSSPRGRLSALAAVAATVH